MLHQKQPANIISDAQFTVYRPHVVAVSKWYDLLAFAHLAEKPVDAPADEPDPIELVSQQAERFLGKQASLYRHSTEDARCEIPADVTLTFVPQLAGGEFNPPSRNLRWCENVQHEDFRMRVVDESLIGQTVYGRLSVFLGTLLLAEINLSIRVVAQGSQETLQSSKAVDRARPYRKVFASYSHKDRQIVKQFEQLANLLGDEYLIDCRTLRTGELWGERIESLIREADIFQLFWSWNSIDSSYVRQEWEHACALERQNFIRPVYWQDPLPSRPEKSLPPPELLRLHFQRMDFTPADKLSGATQSSTNFSDSSDSFSDRLAQYDGSDIPQTEGAIVAAIDILAKYAAKHAPAGSEPLETPKRLEELRTVMPETTTSEVSHKDESRKSRSGHRSIHQKLNRVRKPRCHITYNVEDGGMVPERTLPLVIGVMADLSGTPDKAELVSKRQRSACGSISDRKFLDINRDNFEQIMATMQPCLAFSIPDTLAGEGMLSIELAFTNIDAFSPTAVACQVKSTCKLLQDRRQLNHLLNCMDGLLSNDEQISSTLESVGLTTKDAQTRIEALITELDNKLSQQLRPILQHPQFMQLEGTWRGLRYLVHNTEMGSQLKIRVLNITKQQLSKSLSQAVEWDQSFIFAKIHGQPYGQPEGEPYGFIVGDYYFDHSPDDVQLLTEFSTIAAASHTPFIAGASPSLLGMKSWQEQGALRGLNQIISGPSYMTWQAFRDSPQSRYIVLTVPRVLARLPYGAKTCSAEDFNFEEEVPGDESQPNCWFNAAFAMATVIARAFSRDGWCARIRGFGSGGEVEGIPCQTFSASGGSEVTSGSTEVTFDDRREVELYVSGLAALYSLPKQAATFFVSTPTLHKPARYVDQAEEANDNLSARLQYWLPACRFAQHLKVLARHKLGSFMSRQEMQQWLNRWLQQYVLADSDHVHEQEMVVTPLAAAHIELEDNSSGPICSAILHIQPHYQLEGLTAPLRIPITLPGIPGDTSRTNLQGSMVVESASENEQMVPVGTDGFSTSYSKRLPKSDRAASRQAGVGIRLIDTIEVRSGKETRRLELCEGDLTAMGPEEAVDVLVVSAFPDDYSPTQQSLIGALDRKGVSVQELSKSKEGDLRESFSCWLSHEVSSRQPGLEFQRILCFEPLARGAAPEVVGDIFRSLAPFVGAEPHITSVAMPLVAAGHQGYEIQEILPPLVEAAVHWLAVGLPLQRIRIVAKDELQSHQAQRVFQRLKEKYATTLLESTKEAGYDIFLSYSHVDRDPARTAADHFMKQNLRVFVDELSLDKGASWQQHIFYALDSSSKVLAIYSPDYVSSKVCQEEYNIAWARNRKLSRNIIFPIYWRSAQLPTYMEILQYVDCREEDQKRLEDACSALLTEFTGS